MAGNSTPIFTKVATWAWSGPVMSGNTTKDLTTGTSYVVYTADSTNGGYVKKLRIRHMGVNVATVLRVFINNGYDTTLASNNILYDEIGIASNPTVSEISSSTLYEIPINEALPPGYRIVVTVGTGLANGLAVTAVGGSY